MGLAGEWAAGLALGVLTALWSAGLTVCLFVVVLRQLCVVGDLCHWANLVFGWPGQGLSLPSFLLLDYLACLVGQTERSAYPLTSFPQLGLLRLAWVREPEALERLEVLAAGLHPGPQPPLDPATDESACAALRSLRRIAAADEALRPARPRRRRLLTHLEPPVFCWWPGLAGLAMALRPADWDVARPRLGELLPGLRAALLHRPSAASPRLRALLLRLSADQSRSHLGPKMQTEESRRLNQAAFPIACDEDEDADMVDAAWEVLRERTWWMECSKYAMGLLRGNPQRPMPRLGKLFERDGGHAGGWLVGGVGDPRTPLAGLATQARLGVRWAGLELSRLLVDVPHMDQGSRAAFRSVGGFGSLAPPLLLALRRGVLEADEALVSHCLYSTANFLERSATRPEERALAVGELVGAGLMPLLRDLAGAERRPELARRARVLLGLLIGPAQRLPAALPLSHAQAEEDAYFARCHRPRIPLKLNPHL